MAEGEERIGRDPCFMLMASVVALRSTCLRLQVGSICVYDNRILSSGYNGAPRGLEHCDPETCNQLVDHCRATVHAELNTILNAGYHGVSVNGATIYCTHLPCEACARAIINVGIRRVVYSEHFESNSIRLFKYVGIEVERLPLTILRHTGQE